LRAQRRETCGLRTEGELGLAGRLGNIQELQFNPTAVDFVGPLKRKLHCVLASFRPAVAIVDEKRRKNPRIHDIRKEVLVVSVPMSELWAARILSIQSPKGEPCGLANSPEPSHHVGCMLNIIANGMDTKLGALQKRTNGPAVLPVNPTVCIPYHHQINLGFVNRVEPMDHIRLPIDLRRTKYNACTETEMVDHAFRDVRGIVDVDLPGREILPCEEDVLQQTAIVFLILRTIEAEREDVYHCCL
jgi:hypothetical protein